MDCLIEKYSQGKSSSAINFSNRIAINDDLTKIGFKMNKLFE